MPKSFASHLTIEYVHSLVIRLLLDSLYVKLTQPYGHIYSSSFILCRGCLTYSESTNRLITRERLHIRLSSGLQRIIEKSYRIIPLCLELWWSGTDDSLRSSLTVHHPSTHVYLMFHVSLHVSLHSCRHCLRSSDLSHTGNLNFCNN